MIGLGHDNIRVSHICLLITKLSVFKFSLFANKLCDTEDAYPMSDEKGGF